MEVAIKFPSLLLSLGLRLINLRQKEVNFWSEIFFIHHIEPDAHIGELSGGEDSVDLGLNMPFAQDLESRSNNFHLEEREPCLDQLLHSLKDRNLLLKRDWAVLIE